MLQWIFSRLREVKQLDRVDTLCSSWEPLCCLFHQATAWTRLELCCPVCTLPVPLWMKRKVKVKSLCRVQLFATPWTVAYQASPSMGFSRQESWSGLPSPSPGDLPNPGIEPRFPALQADALPSEPPGKPCPLWISPHIRRDPLSLGSLSTLPSGSRNRKKSPGVPLLHVVNPIPAHRLTCVPVAIFLHCECELGKQAADTPASTGQGVLTPVLLILEASAPLLLSHPLQFCLLGLVVGWVSVSYFLTASTYFPGTPTPSRALLRTVAPLSTVSSCPRSSCSSFIFSYHSMWSGSFFNFQRNFPKTLFKDPSLHPHFLTVMNIFPFYTAFLVISLGLWEGGKETHVFIS